MNYKLKSPIGQNVTQNERLVAIAELIAVLKVPLEHTELLFHITSSPEYFLNLTERIHVLATRDKFFINANRDTIIG